MSEMDEMQPYCDNYRSSSSSASSPTGRAPVGAFFYMRKAGGGAPRRPISFEDSPEWDDMEIEAQLEDGPDSSMHFASTEMPSRSPSKVDSGSLASVSVTEASSVIRDRRITGASVVWKDLTITFKGKGDFSSKAVKSSNGYALPGMLTVIMGPARSGKSALLRAIAGRLGSSARIYGEVFINGSPSGLPYGTYGFVYREDVLIESLTVREMLYYSALMQLPSIPCQNKSAVDDAIAAMSLVDYADQVIGGFCCRKGLSNGERRRISIARELLMRPHIVFVDEPLYNLDSVSALLMMVTLKKLASTGCTLVFTMYQSSTEVFGLFDRICLLSNGNTLFFGETLACLQHFSNAGFPCPIMQSPSDHFLRAINADFDRIIAMCKNLQDDQGDFSSVSMDTAVAIRTLEATYKSSADAVVVESMIAKLTEKEGPQLKTKGRTSDVIRIGVFTWRSLLIMSRDWKYFWVRFMLCIALSIAVATVFINLGNSLSSALVRVSAVYAFVSSIILLSICVVPAHIEEIMIYLHEAANRHSGPMVFLLGNFLAEIPFLFLTSIISSLVFYFLVGLRDEFGLLMYFVINVFMCLVANEALVMLVAYIWLDMFRCIVTLILLHMMMMLAAGYFRVSNALPGPIWKHPLFYVSFHAYAIQGLLENEYVGTSFAVGQVRAIPGVQAVNSTYNISSSRDAKWVSMVALFIMAIVYRILLYVLLRLRARERLLLLLHDVLCFNGGDGDDRMAAAK